MSRKDSRYLEIRKSFLLLKLNGLRKCVMTGAKKMICSLQSTKIQLVAGCWFCHNQSAAEMRYLRHNYPEYWKLLLKWDKDSPIRFTVHHTVEDYEKRFQLEDLGWFSLTIHTSGGNGSRNILIKQNKVCHGDTV